MVPMVGELTVLQFLLNSSSYHVKVKLAKNQLPTPLPGLLLTDLVECNFDGYASVEDPVFELVINDELGYAEGITGPLVFQAGPAVVPQSITAMYVTIRDGAGAEHLLWVQQVLPPVLMAVPDQTFAKRLRMMVADRAT